jgi:hypothetical protein
MMTRSAICLFCLWLVACDGDDPVPLQLPPRTPLPECPDASYEPCDIRERACQKGLNELAACMRDAPPLRSLRMDVVSEAEYAAQVREGLKDLSDEYVVFHQALASLSLAPEVPPSDEDVVQSAVDWIGGFYSDEEKRVVIVDHGYPADSARTNLLLIHELTHALQDADFDLANWPADAPPATFDSSLAQRSVIEGEASFYEYRAAPAFLGIDTARADFDSVFQEHLERLEQRNFDSSTPTDGSFITFPYAYGAEQAYAAWHHGGPRGTDALWASPPLTTQAVMANVLGVNEPQAAGVELAPLDFSVDGLDKDLALTTVDTQGAWGLAIALERATEEEHDELATSWRGDRLSAVQTTAGAVLALWQIELDGAESASKVGAMLSRLPNVDAASSGARVYVSSAWPRSASRRLSAYGKRWLSSD